MLIDFLIETFEQNLSRDAIIWRDRTYDYQALLERLFLFTGKFVPMKTTSM